MRLIRMVQIGKIGHFTRQVDSQRYRRSARSLRIPAYRRESPFRSVTAFNPISPLYLAPELATWPWGQSLIHAEEGIKQDGFRPEAQGSV